MPSLFTFLNLLQAYKHLKLLSTGSDLLDGGTILLPEIVTVYWPLGSQSGPSGWGITLRACSAAEWMRSRNAVV